MFGIATQLVDALVPPAGATAPATPAAPVDNRRYIADDDFVTGAQMRELIETTRNASAESAVELAASSMLGLARQQYSQDFARYGPEITSKLAGVPKHLWTLDNLSTVVRLVRSDHLDEIVRERATQLAAGAPGDIRSLGGSAPAATVVREHSLESEKIPVEWKRRAQAAGVTERVVDEFCRANDMSPEAFYKQFDAPLSRIVEDTPQRKSV